MTRLTPISFIFFIAVFLLIAIKGCKKDTPPPAPTEEELQEEQLTANAEYNGSILPGAGNFFVNADLRPSQAVQQVGALSLGGDSLVLLGSTDDSGNVELVHSAGLVRGGSTSGALVQVSAGGAVSVSAMDETAPVGPVLSLRRVSESGTKISLREYSDDGAYKTLASGYYENGELQAGVLLMDANATRSASSGCPLPEGAGGTYGHLTDLGYIQCMLEYAMGESASFLADYMSASGAHGEAVGDLLEAADRLLATLDGLDRLDELRTYEQSQGSRYAGLVDAYNAASQSAGETATVLKLSPEAPSYSERDGGVLSFRVVVVDTEEGDTSTGEPVYAKVRLASADGATVYFEEVRAVDTGATEIRFDPRQMEGYGEVESLTFSYGLVSDGAPATVNIPITYTVPDKITIKSGNNQEVKMLQEVPELLEVTVTATDGLPIEGVQVIWKITKGGGHFGGNASASVEAATGESGIARAPVKWQLGRKGDQEVSATAYDKDGSVIDETTFVAFVYQPKRELVYFTGLDDHNGVPLDERTPVKIIGAGERFEAYHNVAYAFRVKEDGEFVHGGREILTAFTDGKGPWQQRSGDSFFLEDYAIGYINGQGLLDTLRFDVVVKNTLYDMVVGRILRQRFLNGDITYYQFNKGGSVSIYHNNNMQTETKTYVLTIDEPVGQRGNLFANSHTLWFCEDYTYHEPNIGVVYIGAERGKGISDYDLSMGIQRLYVNENGKLTFNDGLSRGCVDYLLEWAD
ncbi:hypothetical protein [Parapedobacter sp. 10938]|uniref:hypothetical protein n=1 Tax=Parapedobacter flavus TaxID=3110225 RepID=UPI002DB68EDC|nr:hypothetical protein [Parapedobacter sp. 10938]MEC3881751.1 hypothetical protein [Parapedobacter sp. 10938]